MTVGRFGLGQFLVHGKVALEHRQCLVGPASVQVHQAAGWVTRRSPASSSRTWARPLYSSSSRSTFSATDLSALVLKRLKADAEAALGQEVDRAVITVPAYFGDAQRKATIDAGNAAGLQVLRIINEPTAAALAYGLNRAGGTGGDGPDLRPGRRHLRRDRGAISPGGIVVLATAGDHDLGGKNWDDRIATFLAEQFAAETGFDPLDDPVALDGSSSAASRPSGSLSERTLDAHHAGARLPGARAST